MYLYAGNVRGHDSELHPLPLLAEVTLITRHMFSLRPKAACNGACSTCGAKIPGGEA
jgi:hypothetical protein